MLANDVTSVRQRYGRRVWRGIHFILPSVLAGRTARASFANSEPAGFSEDS